MATRARIARIAHIARIGSRGGYGGGKGGMGGMGLIAKKVVGEVMIIEGNSPLSPYPLPPYITDAGQ